jgi:hypothetical protein
MKFTIIDPAEFQAESLFRQDEFLDAVGSHNWEQYRDKMILVRGCGDVIIPPWAYMIITGRLTGIAKSVRYGNEHDNVVVYRTKPNGQRT